MLALAASSPGEAADTPTALPPKEVRLSGPAPTVFEQIGKLYGVRVQVDAELPARPLRLELGTTDFATAMRVAAQLAGALWVAEPDGTVRVAADTPANRAHYQPQVVKTFVLPGRTPEELTEVTRLLRELLDIRRIDPDPRSNTFTVRDTPARLAVAEQLLEQLQGEPGEIWLDVWLLEVERERAQQLGVLPPDEVIAAHAGAGALEPHNLKSLVQSLRFALQRGLLPAVFAGGLSAEGATLPALVLLGGGASTYALHLPETVANLLTTAGVARSARHLSLRAREGQQASFFAGERFPVVFVKFSSSFLSPQEQELRRSGKFVPPVPAIQYEELGVRVTVRPRLHSGREISLGLKIAQEALAGASLNGIPILTNRTLEQQVRLREGETLLVGGLRGRTEEPRSSGLPVLGALPVIGPLFRGTTRSTSSRETEFLILLTPQIVRLPTPNRAALRTFYVGTESEFAPAGAGPGPAVQPPPPQPPRPPVQPQPRPPQPPPEPEPELEN